MTTLAFSGPLFGGKSPFVAFLRSVLCLVTIFSAQIRLVPGGQSDENERGWILWLGYTVDLKRALGLK